MALPYLDSSLWALACVAACASPPDPSPADRTSNDTVGQNDADGGTAGRGGSSSAPPNAGAENQESVGARSSGGAAAGASTAGASTAGGGSGPIAQNACGSAAASGSFEADCLACAADACEACLCRDCSEQLEQCASTPGCPEVLACTRQSGCFGVTCFCGDFDAVACVGGQANGPCKMAILDAPGSRAPSIVDPSAGPASDAAVAIAACADPGRPCAAACRTK